MRVHPSLFAVVASLSSLVGCGPAQGPTGPREEVERTYDEITLSPTLPDPSTTITLTTLSPASGPVGTTVTVRGSNLTQLTRPLTGYSLRFGSSTAPTATFTLVSSTELRAVVPAGAVNGPVVITHRVSSQQEFPGGPLLPPRTVVDAVSSQWFTVTAPPTTGVLRVRNSSQYDITRLVVAGQSRLGAGQAILPGGSFDVTLNGAAVSWSAELGNANTPQAHMFDWAQVTTVTNGSTVTAAVPRFTVPQILTLGGRNRWVGSYFSGLQPRTATWQFTANGGASLLDGNTLIGSSTVREVSWPNNGAQVTFSIDGIQGTMFYPFACFTMRNGPPDWPLIEYCQR